jgi:hypothetical protein
MEEELCREICIMLTISSMVPGMNTATDSLMFARDPQESEWIVGWDEHNMRWVVARFYCSSDGSNDAEIQQAWYWTAHTDTWTECAVQGW